MCAAPSTLTRAGFPLPLLARSLSDNTPTRIIVLNSATLSKKSTPPAEKDGLPRTFTSFIEEILRSRYPDGKVALTTVNLPRATAETVVARLPEVLEKAKPALMIWQTGTYDTILGADSRAFADAVEHGINLAHGAGTDVIVVGPQYSPRTAFAFDVAPYNNTLRWIARTNEVPFFDRYDIMRFWEQEGIFDFDTAPPPPSLFEDVHRCIGRLLVGMITDGVDARTLGSR
ncbi:SGNH/GDSL hydrolase family protein [Ancylobacter sp. A5.8]|uniref:SGNH/GDSL hydrolase family protein n=1 Tax=Ancylobacter gelatini TaxID=2919920 RepID=UPI001F4DC36E|nr:SGNH/GDSL hydrolase family protein [Ancylobacter gelatini]